MLYSVSWNVGSVFGELPVHFRLLWTVPGAFLCEEETVPKADILWEMLGCACSVWQQCCPLHGESYRKALFVVLVFVCLL